MLYFFIGFFLAVIVIIIKDRLEIRKLRKELAAIKLTTKFF
jgi:hypothetical protein